MQQHPPRIEAEKERFLQAVEKQTQSAETKEKTKSMEILRRHKVIFT